MEGHASLHAPIPLLLLGSAAWILCTAAEWMHFECLFDALVPNTPSPSFMLQDSRQIAIAASTRMLKNR